MSSAERPPWVRKSLRQSERSVRKSSTTGAYKINDGYYAGKDPRDYLFHSHDHNVGNATFTRRSMIDGNSFNNRLHYKNWGGHAWNANFDGTDDEIINKNVNEGWRVTSSCSRICSEC